MADVQLKYKKAAIFEDIYPKTKMANLIDWASALASINADIATRQAQLVSGTNIKTINNTSLLGAGNIDIAVSEHTHDLGDLDFTAHVTTTATTEGWYRVATVPLTATKKALQFKLKSYTATGTKSESIIFIDLAYLSTQASSQQTSIVAFTSHSYNSQTNSENGYVHLYIRVSFDNTNVYLDVYKYKTTAVTMECTPLIPSDWVFATGALTVNPTVGSARSTQVTTSAGFNANTGSIGYASSASYTNYGMLGGQTIFNQIDKTNHWAYVGYIVLDYNSSYLGGRSGQYDVKFQELSVDGTKAVANLEDFTAHIKVNMAAHTNGTTWNSTVPTYSITISGNTARNNNDIAALVYSTSTSQKIIRVYLKLLEPKQFYQTYTLNRYGRSFNGTTSVTTSYAGYWVYRESEATITTLPTPPQGTVAYSTKYIPQGYAVDVYPWAKATDKPAYNHDEIADGATYKRVAQSEKDTWNAKEPALSAMTILEGTTGTESNTRKISPLNLRNIIEALSPPGARASNDVLTWAKDGKAIARSGDVNDIITTGFYQGSNMTNAPTTGWYFYIVNRYSSDTNWIHQLAMSFGSDNTANKIYTRTKANGTWGTWAEMYTSVNPSSLLSVYRSYVSDLDTQFTPGQYYFDNSTAGKANATTWGWVHVEVNNNINYNATDNWIRQTLQQTDGKKYYRYRINNGAWTAWFQEYNTQYKPTPADIGAVAQSTFNTLNDAYAAHIIAPNPHGITPAGIGAVPDTRTVAGKQLNANISVAELTAALNLATTSLQGLLSPTDKANLDTLAALLVTSDGDSIVNTINEILAIFANYPEGADLVTALSNKVDKVTGYALSKNDFTDVLKTKLDGISSGAEVNPDVITIAEGTTGTATTKRAVSAVNLKSIIEALSPPGARAASSVTDAILGSGTTGNAVYLRGDRAWSNIPFSHITGTATESQVPTLQISKISGLQSALDSKSGTGHSHSLDALTEGTTNKFVNQTEKNTWNGKQNALGYTPANKAGDTFTGHVVIDSVTPIGGEANSFNITFRYQTGSNPYTKALNVNNGGQLIFDGVAVSMAGHGHAGADITSGTVAAARLGADPTGAKFLRGDNTWQINIVQGSTYMTEYSPAAGDMLMYGAYGWGTMTPQEWAAIGSNSFMRVSSLLATISTATTTTITGLSNYKWLIVEIVAAGVRETRLLRYVTGQSVQISAYIAGSWRYITLQTNPSNIVSTSLTGTPTVYVYGVR